MLLCCSLSLSPHTHIYTLTFSESLTPRLSLCDSDTLYHSSSLLFVMQYIYDDFGTRSSYIHKSCIEICVFRSVSTMTRAGTEQKGTEQKALTVTYSNCCNHMYNGGKGFQKSSSVQKPGRVLCRAQKHCGQADGVRFAHDGRI